MPPAPTINRVQLPQTVNVVPAGQGFAPRTSQPTITRSPSIARNAVVPFSRPRTPAVPPKQSAQFQQQYRPGAPGGFSSRWAQRQRQGANYGSNPDPGAQFVADTAGQPFLAGIIDQLQSTPIDSSNAWAWYSDDPTNVSQNSYQAGRQLTNNILSAPANLVNWAGSQVTNAWDFYKNAWNNRPNFSPRGWKLPNFQLPSFQTPTINLPKINLPQIDLPDFDFNQPDISDPARQPDPAQRNNRRQRDRSNPSQRNFVNSPSTNQIDKIVDSLPSSCYASLFLIRHRIVERDRFGDTVKIISHSQPGRGPLVPESSQTDLYGNTINSYPGDPGSAGNFGGWAISAYGVSGGYHLGGDTYVEYTWLAMDVGSGGYSSEIEPQLQRLMGHGIDGYGLDGIQVYCSFPPPYQPFINFNSPPPDPPPTPPDDDDDDNGDDDMSCCSCSEIAAIMKKTLQACKFKAEIPVVSCKYFDDTQEWAPQVSYVDMEIFAVDEATAKAQAALYLQLAQQAMDICEAKNYVYATAAAVGVDDYPVTTPNSLISDDDGKDQEQTELTSLTQLFSWYVERFDEIVGQFEIPIRIKDTDLVQAGDQSKTIKLPNIAEAIAEMFMLVFQANINTETLINMCTRLLYEGGQDKQQNFITYKLLYSLVDWAGYKTKDVAEEMPLLFSPDKTKLSEILTESKIRVGTQVLDEKFGLEIDLMRFRKAAAVIDAVHFRKINPFADIAPQIMAYLLGAKDTSDKLNDDAVEDDFEDFITQVEEGFKNTTGITDANLPYGKPYEQRPKIRDLTKIDPPTNP